MKINPQSFLDILQLEIRGYSRAFSSKKKKDRKSKELLLGNEIEILEKQLAQNVRDDNYENINQVLQGKKIELENLCSYQAQGAYIRAKARYKIEGEKPSQLFCALEKHNAIQKHIPKLIVEKGGLRTELTEQKAIEGEIHDYYREFFSNKDTLDQ